MQRTPPFSLTCLSFMCSFGHIFQQLRERKTERVFKERVLFLALVYLTICGGWGRGGGSDEQAGSRTEQRGLGKDWQISKRNLRTQLFCLQLRQIWVVIYTPDLPCRTRWRFYLKSHNCSTCFPLVSCLTSSIPSSECFRSTSSETTYTWILSWPASKHLS